MVKDFIVTIKGGFYASGLNLLDKAKVTCNLRREVSFEKIRYSKLANIFVNGYKKLNSPGKRKVRFQWDQVKKTIERPFVKNNVSISSSDDEIQDNNGDSTDHSSTEPEEDVNKVELEDKGTPYTLETATKDIHEPEPKSIINSISPEKQEQVDDELQLPLMITDIPRYTLENDKLVVDEKKNTSVENCQSEDASEVNEEIIVSEDKTTIGVEFLGECLNAKPEPAGGLQKTALTVISRSSLENYSSDETIIIDDDISECSDNGVTASSFYCYYIPIRFKPKGCIKSAK
ncbi:hypothetical protein BEWA_027920 [Theileria equi strain WA]|uniref:Uncharacterized protein n=1 Tax=Theileria equi strain WA TaxID=1537102 RepID=L0AXI3_THEEQ|nr:hypothetical protein BEWA_027920 [Theileria equi strain WA]AFZ79943.1 hypothetical protein BEWA_027920 [Theileria equi strain WA]|eukprot:XP_004829609.1 hypothetical protein BEWA_027920 [Theileria equi strain WA]